MTRLFRITYVSASLAPVDEAVVDAILDKSRRNNPAREITGMLVNCQQEFFQVLEGPRPAVEALFQRISKDPRHARVVILLQEEIDQRAFAGWTMAYASLSHGELQAIAGQDSLADLENGLQGAEGLMLEALARAFLERARDLAGH